MNGVRLEKAHHQQYPGTYADSRIKVVLRDARGGHGIESQQQGSYGLEPMNLGTELLKQLRKSQAGLGLSQHIEEPGQQRRESGGKLYCDQRRQISQDDQHVSFRQLQATGRRRSRRVLHALDR